MHFKNHQDENGNSLNIGNGCTHIGADLKFMEKNAKVSIGNKCNLNACNIVLGRNSELVIGDDVLLRGNISVGLNSKVIIGNGLRVTSNLYIRAVESTTVTIGEDCLFASDIKIRTNDGHPIYDSITKERINKSGDIIIGNHVWLADDVVVLKSVTIEDCVVIAMRSVVTKNIASNSIAAGAPAKVVRENIVWEHNTKTQTEKYYSE